EGSLGVFDASLGEVERMPVVGPQQVEPERVRGVAPRQIVDRLRVTERLRHLLAAEVREPIVHPEARERPAGGALGLGDLVLVVREDQVFSAPVYVEALAKV